MSASSNSGTPSINNLDPETIFRNIVQVVSGFLNDAVSQRTSVTEIRGIVERLRQLILPYLTSQQIEEWLEAKCADFLVALTQRSTERFRNRWSYMSATQLSFVHRNVMGFANKRTTDHEKREKARCVLAAALYSIKHNREASVTTLRSMLRHSATRNGIEEVAEETEEFVGRRKRIMDLTSATEESPLLHQDKPEHVEDVREDYAFVSTQIERFIAAIKSIESDLLKVSLETKEDSESVEAIQAQFEACKVSLQPTRVAVVGEVSAGKSTFINNIVGYPHLVKADCGPVTAIITEIEYAPIRNFRATILFTSQDEHQREINDYIQNVENNDNYDEEDVKLLDLEAKLMEFYGYDQDNQAISFHFDDRKDPAHLLGKPPLVIERGSLAELRAAMDDEPILKVEKDRTPNPLMYAVKLIRITGPFEHIPPGVILLDTPGLGDAEISRSYKTISVLSTVHVVWYANSVVYQMGKEWDHEILNQIKLLGNLVRDVVIVGTMADTETARTSDCIDAYRKNILNALCHHYLEVNNIKIRPVIRTKWDLLEAHMKQHYQQDYETLLAEANNILIDFSTKDDILFDDAKRWRALLRHYSSQQSEAFTQQTGIMQELVRKFENDEWGNTNLAKLRSVARSYKMSLATLKNSLDQLFSHKLSSLLSGITQQLEDRRINANTRMAIMNPNESRCGEFIGKRGPNRVAYDVNEVIASHWLQLIRPAWNRFLSDLLSIQGTLTSMGSNGALASNLHQNMFQIGQKFFELSIKPFIRAKLRESNVYKPRRSTFPREDELRELFIDQLRPCMDSLFGNPDIDGELTHSFNMVITNLSTRTGASNRAVRDIILRLRDIVNNTVTPTDQQRGSSQNDEDRDDDQQRKRRKK